MLSLSTDSPVQGNPSWHLDTPKLTKRDITQYSGSMQETVKHYFLVFGDVQETSEFQGVAVKTE